MAGEGVSFGNILWAQLSLDDANWKITLKRKTYMSMGPSAKILKKSAVIYKKRHTPTFIRQAFLVSR